MEQTMKKKWLKAGITAYVLMMLGFAIMFYLFGFTTVWDNYSTQSVIGEGSTNITNPDTSNLNSLLDINHILLYIVGGGLIAVGTIILGAIFGVAGTIVQIIFPIYLLMIFNIFIFPVMPGAETHINDVFPLTAFLIGFFNLWFILALIEFIRG